MGIFANVVGIWTEYRVKLQFRDRVAGGVPRDPRTIEAWIINKTGLVDDVNELRLMVLRTLEELGQEIDPNMSYEQILAAGDKIAGLRHCNGFKRDEKGIYLEDRQVKAAIKETINILFADRRWGATAKGPKNFAAERVFVEPAHLSLGMSEPSGIFLFNGHPKDQIGKRATLTRYEYALRPEMTFKVRIHNNDEINEVWPAVWEHMQVNGIGALRSQGLGTFDILEWECLRKEQPLPLSAREQAKAAQEKLAAAQRKAKEQEAEKAPAPTVAALRKAATAEPEKTVAAMRKGRNGGAAARA